MIIVNPPSPRALHGTAAVLTKALQQYAQDHPGGGGGAMLELRDVNDQLAIRICLDESEMAVLAARLRDDG